MWVNSYDVINRCAGYNHKVLYPVNLIIRSEEEDNIMQSKYKVLVKVTQKQPAWCMIVSAQDHKEAVSKAIQAGAVEVKGYKLIK